MSNNDFNLNPERNSDSHIAVPFCSTTSGTTFDETDPVCRAKELLTLSNAMPNGINFEQTGELALECVNEILEHWLPNGEQRGNEYVALNPTRHDGKPGSFKINTETGVWADFATDDKGSDLINLVAYVEHGIKQTDAAVKILQFLAKATIHKPTTLAIVEKAKSKAATTIKDTVVMPVPDEMLSKRPTFFVNHTGNRGGCLVKVKQIPQLVLQVVDSNALRLRLAGCR
ncbi:hypothetical protein DFR37_111144, partial [Eoetvoesiella caeni]